MLPSIIQNMWLSPTPIRKIISIIVRTLKLLPYHWRIELFMEKRPHYAYCLLKSAELAQKLGVPRISAIEFGVAGGNGLVNLEYHAKKISRLTSVEIELYGFDSGEGLPKPQDYRDLPYHWQEGFFKMGKCVLFDKLNYAKVVLGDVEESCWK